MDLSLIAFWKFPAQAFIHSSMLNPEKLREAVPSAVRTSTSSIESRTFLMDSQSAMLSVVVVLDFEILSESGTTAVSFADFENFDFIQSLFLVGAMVISWFKPVRELTKYQYFEQLS
nr:TPA_asm: hypothetical protein [Sclerotinia sclerotiorum negative-stranded RNA virus 5]